MVEIRKAHKFLYLNYVFRRRPIFNYRCLYGIYFDAISPSAVYSRSRLLYVLPPSTHTLPDHLELGTSLSQVIKPQHKAPKGP
jgi:hypothetical protein